MPRQADQSLRVLLLEDDPRDAELVELALKQGYPSCALVRVEERTSFVHALETFQPDVILSDHAVPGFTALDALHLVQASVPACPVLVISGTFEPPVVKSLKAGAAAFVSKGNLTLLPQSVHEALEVRSPLRRLTARQLQVLHLMAGGHSTRETARRLRLSVKTIESHRAQVMKRLGMKDMVSLIRFAIRTGIISPE